MRAPKAVEVLKNFRFLDQNRSDLAGQYKGYWVASLDEKVYTNPNLSELIDSMEGIPNSHSAYIENM